MTHLLSAHTHPRMLLIRSPHRAVVVAQYTEVRGSNPDTSKFLSNIYLLSTEGIEKTKIKEKEAENGAFKKIRSPLPWPIHNTHT